MKNILFLLLIISFNALSQKPTVAVESIENNVLYRNYQTSVIVAVSGTKRNKIEILGSDNIEIKATDRQNHYILKPSGRDKTASIYVVAIKKGHRDTLRTIQYRLLDLPDPTLFWGGAQDNEKANCKEPALFAKYLAGYTLNATFNVQDWKLKIGADTISGTGSNISRAHELFKKINEDTEVIITTTIIGPDGLKRKIVGRWIISPWDKTPESNVINMED